MKIYAITNKHNIFHRGFFKEEDALAELKELAQYDYYLEEYEIEGTPPEDSVMYADAIERGEHSEQK